MDRPVTGPHLDVVMIGGTGRSGSNLLKAALGRIPGVMALPFETRFAVDPDGLLPAYRALNQPLSPFEAHRVLTRLERLLRQMEHQSLTDSVAILLERWIKCAGLGPINLRAYKEWELERHAPGYGDAVSRLMAGLEAGRYGGIWPGRTGWRRHAINRIARYPGDPAIARAAGDFLREVFGAISRGAEFYVADETYSLFYAHEWRALWPDMHLVHMVRDPRDVVTSLMHQRWAPPALDQALAFYAGSMGAIRSALNDLPGPPVITLRLEKLLADPEAQLRTLCEQLGLPFAPEMAALDFSHGNLGRWRTDIPARDQARLTADLAEEMERLGYACD